MVRDGTEPADMVQHARVPLAFGGALTTTERRHTDHAREANTLATNARRPLARQRPGRRRRREEAWHRASLHQQTRQLKDAVAVFEISDSVLAGSRQVGYRAVAAGSIRGN
ncbi:hypothetical protein PBS_36550 [Paraburkholderia sp. 2C]